MTGNGDGAGMAVLDASKGRILGANNSMDCASTADVLIERARVMSGLEDFGSDGFREGLERLVSSVVQEARLTARGRATFDNQVLNTLVSRLQIEHWYSKHPEIDEEEIVAPLIGLGLPRTGSTALSCLLAEDPNVRSIRTWESLQPCPPPESATEHTDPRIAATDAMMAQRNAVSPRMQSMLPTTATSPSECQTFMAYDFKAQLFVGFYWIPSYAEWLYNQADMEPTYRYVKRVLKLLQWRCPPRRWRLKNPSHSLFIDSLSRVFPDARYWMTHRDVASVIPSVADLHYESHLPLTEHSDRPTLGRMNVEWTELGLKRVMAFREAGNEDRFFDVHFEQMQQDPFPVLERLYRFLGEELTADTVERMKAWRENTPRDKHGLHTYLPADFGIDIAALRDRFRFYLDRFDVAISS